MRSREQKHTGMAVYYHTGDGLVKRYQFTVQCCYIVTLKCMLLKLSFVLNGSRGLVFVSSLALELKKKCFWIWIHWG